METLILTSSQRKSAFIKLGNFLKEPDETLTALIQNSQYSNGWFTPDQVSNAVESIAGMLQEANLDKWFAGFEDKTTDLPLKNIGLILAGNIPLVGLHDVLCVLAAGHGALIKLSSQDSKLLPFILTKLVEFEPGFTDKFQFIERLAGFDAVIATGSNNTSRYFDYYFSKVPHIIRKNRSSIAVLSGDETKEQLELLGKDIFSYFGLGCRNVSKLFVPENYNFGSFFAAIQSFETIGDHHKYNNNYDYNKSIYLVNRAEHLDNGFLLLKEDESLASPLAVLYHETYSDISSLENKLGNIAENLQCVVSKISLNIPVQVVGFGESQCPALWDYADGVDTMKFLTDL